MSQLTEETAQALVRALDATVGRFGDLVPLLSDGGPLNGLTDRLAAVADFPEAASNLGRKFDSIVFALRSAVEASDRLEKAIPRLPTALADVTSALERLERMIELSDKLSGAVSQVARIESARDAAVEIQDVLREFDPASEVETPVQGFLRIVEDAENVASAFASRMRDVNQTMGGFVRSVRENESAIHYIATIFSQAGWRMPPRYLSDDSRS